MLTDGNKTISQNKAWTFVLLGGALEIVWASGFKYEQIPWLAVIGSLLFSFDLIIRATKVLPVGTVYAVFAGIGTIGTTVVEAVITPETFQWIKIPVILVLLFCIIGLKLTAEGTIKGGGVQ
ncbi:SMR family transporter [Desulforamulus ruminis]|uniref:DMT family transporter n=1 Tax=Desulforamulus ruminis TaxID=1564 RepID=UPI0002F34F59